MNLENKANDQVSTLSHGDKRKLEISLALSMKPKLFLFDEDSGSNSLCEY